jgi:hypothetical protein
MALDVYLQSFQDGLAGGGDAASALAFLQRYRADLDGFGAWQIDLDDEGGVEVTGLSDLEEAEPDEAWALSCLVRLAEWTPRSADFLFGLAQRGRMAVIVPHEDAPGGAYVLLPMDVDREDLPDEDSFDAPEGIESARELFAALAPLQQAHRADRGGDESYFRRRKPGVIARFWRLVRGKH